MKIKDFESNPVKKQCQACSECQEALHTIRINATDRRVTYQGSGMRGFRHIYIMKLCDTCFDKVHNKIIKLSFK